MPAVELVIAAVLLALVGVVAWIALKGRSGGSKPAPIAQALPTKPADDKPAPVAKAAPAARPAPAPAAAPVATLASVPESEDERDDVTALSARAPELDAQVRAMSAASTDADDEIEVSLGEENTNPTLPFALILVSAVGQTDVGRRREHNEDSYLALPDHHLFAIADGMGGHAAGEVASRMAVEAIGRAFESGTFPGEADPARPWRGDQLVRAVQGANAEVFSRANADEALKGMGTTLVAARFTPNKQRVYIAHVGDSRCYRARQGSLEQLTTDHTAALLGLKGKEAHRLIRAVGVWEEIDVDLIVDSPEPGDTYLLCSDGLSKMLTDARILELLGDGRDLEASCRALVDAANARGGLDNVTVILVGVQGVAHVATGRAG